MLSVLGWLARTWRRLSCRTEQFVDGRATVRRSWRSTTQSANSSIHHTTLLAVQGCLGLDHTTTCPLHCCRHSVYGSFHADLQGRWTARRDTGKLLNRITGQLVIVVVTYRWCKVNDPVSIWPTVNHWHVRRHHVYCWHSHQLSHDVSTQWRGRQRPAQDRIQLHQVLVPHWCCRSHSIWPTFLRNWVKWCKLAITSFCFSILGGLYVKICGRLNNNNILNHLS